jgi:hypothetical protein
VAVGVALGVTVGVSVGVSVGVTVTVAVGVGVRLGVSVGVGVGFFVVHFGHGSHPEISKKPATSANLSNEFTDRDAIRSLPSVIATPAANYSKNAQLGNCRGP